MAIDTTISLLTEISNSIANLLAELNIALIQVEYEANTLNYTLTNGISTLNKEEINKLTLYKDI